MRQLHKYKGRTSLKAHDVILVYFLLTMPETSSGGSMSITSKKLRNKSKAELDSCAHAKVLYTCIERGAP